MKLLIVEDEAITAILLKIKMEEKGYHILGPVASGEEAIDVAVNDKPDIILMDIKLYGDMDGIEAARIILKHKRVLFVFTTGYNEDEIVEKAMKLRPLAFMIKPVNPDDIDNLIRNHLRHKR